MLNTDATQRLFVKCEDRSLIRRTAIALALTVPLLLPVVAGASGHTALPRKPVPVGAIPANVPVLRGAVTALATLVRIDPKASEGEFRTGCGWYTKLQATTHYVIPKSKLRPGLWRVSLRGIEFDLNSAAGKAYGYTQAVSRATWERHVRLYGWSGHLVFGNGLRLISNAGFTDVCHGVLG